MIISKTPLRISFLGGGTDFPGFYNENNGAVISSAVDKFIYVIVKPRFDDKVVLHYTKTETVDTPEELQHEIIRVAMMVTGIEKGIEVATLGDIPSEGTGLGSSSSLTVGLLHAFYAYQGIEVDAEKLADEACKIEIDIMGKPIGKQDQYIAAYGGMRMFTFSKDRIDSFHFKRRIRRQVEARTLLFYTGITRQADRILGEQKERIADNTETLKKMLKTATTGSGYLDAEKYRDFGELIKESWEQKKTLASNITTPEISEMLSDAVSAGAIGYKICGAGGGGFLLLYCNDGDRDAVRAKMSIYQELPVKLEEQGSRIICQED
jgi:D-glycero-alpha-D-manno-heptose-7-phosphate kinase|tara:strand:+ start:253 stop:1218 length:966 start_codon:yes stop_codon:yes gene_type:complete